MIVGSRPIQSMADVPPPPITPHIATAPHPSPSAEREMLSPAREGEEKCYYKAGRPILHAINPVYAILLTHLFDWTLYTIRSISTVTT